MSFFTRLLKARPDPREALRPLWRQVIAIAREAGWYTKGGVSDTMAGRFDMVTLVLALVMLRMDGREELKQPSARLTELFVEDMEGQLRQSGVGDVVVGKRIGKLMSVLGGRIEALRSALAASDNDALIAAVERNVTLSESGDPAAIAVELRGLESTLARVSDADLLSGAIPR